MVSKIIFTIGCMLVIFGCGACVSTGRTDNSVIEHTQRIAELEAANRQLTDRLDKYDSIITGSISSLESIGQRAAAAGTTVDRVIELFDQYQSEVERLIRQYQQVAQSGTNS